VTNSSDATRAAEQAIRTVPIVIAVSSAPMEQGLVASLARPIGNNMRLSMLAPAIAGKQALYQHSCHEGQTRLNTINFRDL
jgi:putative ABC transport system substrate-binding protein